MIKEITNPELAQWYHATLSIPVNDTLIQEIKKVYFDTWTNLKIELITNHLPSPMATAKGQMHQTRKNLKLTKPQEPKTLEELPTKTLAQRTTIVFTNIIDHKQQIDTDLIGKLPVTYNRGNKYLFVLYDYDSN